MKSQTTEEFYTVKMSLNFKAVLRGLFEFTALRKVEFALLLSIMWAELVAIVLLADQYTIAIRERRTVMMLPDIIIPR